MIDPMITPMISYMTNRTVRQSAQLNTVRDLTR
jgi:hypothetical protein